MNYLLNYRDFLFEGNRIIDFYIPTTKFINDEPLIREIDTIYNYQEIKIKISYNTSYEHDIIKKLKERGNLRSTSEFNTLLKKSIEQIIPARIGKELKKDGKYELYLSENKISILILYQQYKIFDNNPEITVITIMTGDVNDCLDTIIINDENFLISEKFRTFAVSK